MDSKKQSDRPQIQCAYCTKVSASGDKSIWPFCSERCKTADLGKWASEGYRIPVESSLDEENIEDSAEEE
jgi:endogenous inhibitor of DNA gyrase (YacG/DUF329 family)